METEEQLADLIGPDTKRLVEIWNGLAGVMPVTKFANRKSATERIWRWLRKMRLTNGRARRPPTVSIIAKVRALPVRASYYA